MINNRTRRMTTAVERVFRPLPNGLFREIMLHFINFLNEDGSIKSSKLDKEIEGGLFKAATSDKDISAYGEVMYTFPDHDEPTRLIAIKGGFEDYRYGRV